MRYFLELSYLGTRYHGWQKQNNANTVQEDLEKTLSTIFSKDVTVLGCGRTDAGVHARSFYAHIVNDIEITDKSKVLYALNGILSKDIAIHDIHEVESEAHARFDATSRSYEYHVNSCKNPFKQELSWDFRHKLNLDLMNEASKLLLVVEEFGAFCKLGSDAKTMFCDVTEANWVQMNENLIFHITADRFLRNMVRAIVGTLVEIGLGKRTIEEFKEIIKSQNRNKAGVSAPAQGLYLTKITYPYMS